MKKDMMIVGIKAVNENIMEIELVPVASMVQKVNPLELAMDGDPKKLFQLFENQKQQRDKIYLTREYCSENQLLPFQSIIISFNPATGFEKERIHKKVKNNE